MLDLLKFSFTHKYRKDFLEQLNFENVNKVTKVSTLIPVLELIYIPCGIIKGVNVVPNIVFFIAITLMILITSVISKRNTFSKHINLLVCGTMIIFLAFGISATFKNMGNSQHISAYVYIMMVIGVSGLVCLKPLTNVILLLSTYAIFLVPVSIMIKDSAIQYLIIANTAAMNLFSITLNMFIFKLKYDSFIDKQDLLGKNEMLTVLTSLDHMTKLYNHDCIKLHLKECINLAKSNSYKLTIAMLDIDDFKKVNDTYGHLVGDEVLKIFATVLKESVRSYDIVGRFGGEEFIIIFKRTGVEEVSEIISRIRKRLQKVIPIHNIRLQFSCGISEFKDETVDELIESADKKLYYVKKHGKNSFISELPDNYEDVICK